MFSNFLIEMKPSNGNLDYRNIYSSLTDMTTYNESVFSSIKYDSTTYPMSCDVTISHVQINCSNIPPGTGTHNITVEVGNQISSISPTSVTYNPPIVSGGISTLTTSGYEVLEILGSNLADRGKFVNVMYGPYNAKYCRIINSGRIVCVTTPGNGINHTIFIHGVSTLNSVSYSAPELLSASHEVLIASNSTSVENFYYGLISNNLNDLIVNERSEYNMFLYGYNFGVGKPMVRWW